MPLAWRGLAGCLVRRPVAVVCVCSACGGGRTATRELACGETKGEKGGVMPQSLPETSGTSQSLLQQMEVRRRRSRPLLRGVVEILDCAGETRHHEPHSWSGLRKTVMQTTEKCFKIHAGAFLTLRKPPFVFFLGVN